MPPRRPSTPRTESPFGIGRTPCSAVIRSVGRVISHITTDSSSSSCPTGRCSSLRCGTRGARSGTDGRPLPEAPDPRFLGYSVGRWEGDTFVIESYGFDERTWLSEDRRERTHGFPHSEELRTVERYTRVAHNNLDVSLTITDPEMYEAPWETTGEFLLNPGTELWEDFCVPTEAEWFNREVLRPATNAAPLE